jgi:nicotinate-nucleotide adenylyltransferase
MPSLRRRALRIGIFGGSFDPVHKAHIELALKARKQFRLDKVIFVPAKTPPHKTKKTLLDAGQRLEMLKIALPRGKAFTVDLYETKRPGTSFTYDTLKHFRRKFSKAELFFIMGSDSLKDLHTWKNHEIIPEISRIITGRRSGSKVNGNDKRTLFVRGRIKNISATLIRTLIKDGKSIHGFVPVKVEEYIEKNNLYR